MHIFYIKDGEFIKVPEALGCLEANRYCKDNYGTSLATIATDQDRARAQALLSSGEIGWIGLYSDTVQTKWRFKSGEECPSSSAFKCVDFWLYQMNENTNFRPRCIGPSEGGHECAYFDVDRNGVDNDESIDQELPFLCEI